MSTELTPGSTFAGRYVIGDVLGDGGYGRVFEAQDHEVGRRVALKVLRPDMADGSYSHEKRERFRREAATVANLQDPHTVTLFDHGETPDGLLYMVFEFVNGTPLNDLLKRGPLRADIATRIIRQVLQSLREAHAAGILHRDLKPENIIVHDYGDEQYRAKLVDFGLAKSTLPNGEVPLTASGLVMGTAAYVSPEAYRLQPLSPASDLFGLGLVFYEMVVGQAANQAGSAMEIATQMVDPAEFVVPQSVPEPTRSIVTRMIRKNPQERYQTANEVLAHLPESTLDSPYASQQVMAGAYSSQDSMGQAAYGAPAYAGAGGGGYSNGYQYGGQPQGYDDGYGQSQGYDPYAQQQYSNGQQYQDPYGQNGHSHGYDQGYDQGYQSSYNNGSQGYDPMRPPTLIEGQSPEDLGMSPSDFGPSQPITREQPHLQYSQAHMYSQGQHYEPAPMPTHPPHGAPHGAPRRRGSVIGFTLGLVVVLFTLSVALITALGIRMPWDPGAGGPQDLEPKVFDLTSTDTQFLWVDWTKGILLAHDPGEIPAAGRCALILDSNQDPTPKGSFYVINALEPVDPQVTAYAVGPEELKLIAENCYAAAEIAENMYDTSMILAGEAKIRDVEARNQQRAQRRSRVNEMGGGGGGQPDISKMLKGGGGGLPGMLQGFLK